MAQTQSQTQEPLSTTTIEDDTHVGVARRRHRKVLRCCKVFAAPEKLQSQWAGLKTFVQVERSGIRDGQSFQERQFYICSQIMSAKDALTDTQKHWGIENRLHWVRDVTFSEDFPLRRGGNAPVNWAILHNFFITLARFLGFRTIPQAQRALANQIQKVFSFFV
ncbi:hypothetical protein CDG76_31290 [Nostoc sp. 'Peltigera membranacea cyanobiont' 210A]|nr:hypothetical protein CDG76_31290 [Nostoc sp. 'Peltigera membranacea cyanobiont' 210A]